MTKPTLTLSDLQQFTGSEEVCRHPINRKVCYTEGVLFLAERAGAFWLIDEIVLIQPYDKRVSAQEFQVWTLKVNTDRTAQLACEDGNGNAVYTKQLSFTDFPLPQVSLWFSNNTLYLPSEH